ncbi:MAG: hypothetical protein ACI8VC_002845 [Candidatus Endobugula sp.]|jgi:hypothetical protein
MRNIATFFYLLALMMSAVYTQFVAGQNIQPAFHHYSNITASFDSVSYIHEQQPLVAKNGNNTYIYPFVNSHELVNASTVLWHPLRNRVTISPYRPPPNILLSSIPNKPSQQAWHYQNTMLAAAVVYVGYEVLFTSYAWLSGDIDYMPPLLGRLLHSRFNHACDLLGDTNCDLRMLFSEPIFVLGQLPYSQLLVNALDMANYEILTGGLISELTEIELFNAIVQEEDGWQYNPIEVDDLIDTVVYRYDNHFLVNIVNQMIDQHLTGQIMQDMIMSQPEPDLQDEFRMH